MCRIIPCSRECSSTKWLNIKVKRMVALPHSGTIDSECRDMSSSNAIFITTQCSTTSSIPPASNRISINRSRQPLWTTRSCFPKINQTSIRYPKLTRYSAECSRNRTRGSPLNHRSVWRPSRANSLRTASSSPVSPTHFTRTSCSKKTRCSCKTIKEMGIKF